MSNRETILAAFKTMLESVTLANGFESEVTRVVRKMVMLDDPTISFPVLMVLGGGEIFEDTLGSKTLSRLSIKIMGYTKEESEPEVSLNKLIRDVIVILESPTYNTYSSKYRPIRLDTDEGWLNLELSGLALFEYIVEVIYMFNRDNP